MSLTNIGAMIATIDLQQVVNPVAYNAFVQSTVTTLTPKNPVIANAYIQVATDITRVIIVAALLLIILLVVLLCVATTRTIPNINRSIIILAIMMTVLISALTWAAFTSIFATKARNLAPKVQKDVSDTVIYAANSVIRDLFYLFTNY